MKPWNDAKKEEKRDRVKHSFGNCCGGSGGS